MNGGISIGYYKPLGSYFIFLDHFGELLLIDGC
jgi:hypothetical protein